LHILHIDTGREMRGGQWQVLYLLRGLRDCGHTAVLLTHRRSPLWQRADLPCHELSIRSLRQQSRYADVVHVHDARAHTWAALFSPKPFVVSRRVGFPVKRGPMSRWKYQRAARFLAISEFVRDQLVHAGINLSRIDIVYDGVPVLPPAAEPHVIVAPQFADSRKGTALAAQSAALAGFDLRFSSDLQADLSEASLFLYLSDMEGLGSAALLAMSAGVPVIASAAGGLKEVVRHETTGLLVQNEPNAIAAAIQRCQQNPKWAAQLGANGRRRVLECFTIQHMVNRTLNSYRKALSC
jgi:glycosyltransferase involved in cell wall biosynthesis